jgi:hypothetical protein
MEKAKVINNSASYMHEALGISDKRADALNEISKKMLKLWIEGDTPKSQILVTAVETCETQNEVIFQAFHIAEGINKIREFEEDNPFSAFFDLLTERKKPRKSKWEERIEQIKRDNGRDFEKQYMQSPNQQEDEDGIPQEIKDLAERIGGDYEIVKVRRRKRQ